jgi:hypothetical protein
VALDQCRGLLFPHPNEERIQSSAPIDHVLQLMGTCEPDPGRLAGPTMQAVAPSLPHSHRSSDLESSGRVDIVAIRT